MHAPRSLLIALLSASALAAPIPGTFKQINCDGGGWFEQIIPHSSGRLYGRTDVGGLYRSNDHGNTWQFLSADLPSQACHLVQGVAVASNPDIVFQAVGTSYSREAGDHGRGIWKSTNGGGTWTQVLADVTFSGNDEQRWGGECIVFQPGSDTELWAGSRGDGLWHSTASGNLGSWHRVVDARGKPFFYASATKPETNVLFAGILICPAIVDPPAPERIWAYGDGGAWLSLDHGVTWVKKIPVARIYRMVQKPDGTTFAAAITTKKGGPKFWRIQPGNIAKVPTQAPNWKAALKLTDLYAKRVTPPRTPPKGYLAALPYAPSKESHTATVQVLSNGDLIASDLFENTCRSADNGDSFTRLPMTLDPAAAKPGWATPGVTVIDGGRNSLIEDPTLASRLFLGGGYAPFRSDDGGATWRYIANGVGETVAWHACFDPANANRVWLPLADLGCTVVNDAGVSGASSGYIAPHFQPTDANPDADIVMFTRRLLISTGRVIAPGGEQTGHRARFYQTTNAGVNWTAMKTDLSATGKGEVLDAVASPTNANDVLVVLAGTGGVWRTANISDEAASVNGAKFVKATGLPGFDAGSEFNVNVCLERDPQDANTCYLLLRGKGFYTSSDGGSSWSDKTSELQSTANSTFGVLHVDAGTRRVWLGLFWDSGSGVGLQWRDFNSTTWNGVSGVQSVAEFDARDGRVAIIGRLTGGTYDQILHSSNSGTSWGEISGGANGRFPTAQAVAVDPAHLGTVWISTNGRAIARFQPQ